MDIETATYDYAHCRETAFMLQVQWKFTEWTNYYTIAEYPGVHFSFVENSIWYHYYTLYIGVSRFKCTSVHGQIGVSVDTYFVLDLWNNST